MGSGGGNSEASLLWHCGNWARVASDDSTTQHSTAALAVSAAKFQQCLAWLRSHANCPRCSVCLARPLAARRVAGMACMSLDSLLTLRWINAVKSAHSPANTSSASRGAGGGCAPHRPPPLLLYRTDFPSFSPSSTFLSAQRRASLQSLFRPRPPHTLVIVLRGLPLSPANSAPAPRAPLSNHRHCNAVQTRPTHTFTMRYTLAAGAIMAASISPVAADACNNILGNYYCKLVDKIQYTGLNLPGTYQKVTGMYPTCQTTPQKYSGPLSPLNEEVSLHFRGPMTIKQVAVYTPGTSSKTKARRTPLERRHGHAAFHKREKEIREIQERAEEEKRQIGATVTATMDGKIVHWINQYGGPGQASATPTPSAASVAAAAVPTSAGYIAPASHDDDTASSQKVAAGDWARTAYYDADSLTAEGITFLNNFGGAGSGVFDNTYGNSLSYASADGNACASGPQVSNGTLASNKEVIMFTDTPCKDGSCGYYREGAVAYHGFDGDSKLFLFEFSMPNDGTSGWNMNMPSLWMLNAQIPRTGQYSGCSCWKTGCGEFDICEVLDSGNAKCKSTYHGNTPGGSSDYFDRPVDAPIKMALLMAGGKINVLKLDDGFDFASSMTGSAVNKLAVTQKSNPLFSLFALAS